MTKQKILIIGGGAGGLEMAVGLAKRFAKQFEVVLVDKEKTHVWKPHLHEIAAYLVKRYCPYLNIPSKKYNYTPVNLWTVI